MASTALAAKIIALATAQLGPLHDYLWVCLSKESGIAQPISV
ncbi:uncharacterized protein An07g05190 [Aspergillus niger]|uniref:Contig An07c0130, genomic contig n=2 Tax=Aspergillus niger TaxID=5061 RepID=A2QNC9_ASPNC|nr:uncharacterized protein An07g05190 [Aspergillus niger]CAK39438.1 unnamed protein product [Aspergillus niger]